MNDLKERLLRLLSEHPDWGRTKLARELGCSEKNIRTLRKQLRKEGRLTTTSPQPQTEVAKEGLTFEDNGKTGYLYSSSREIRTLEDLLRFAEVDTKLWEVDRYVVNKWDMGYKDADKKADKLPLYQIKAWLKKRVVVEQTRQLVTELLAAFKEQSPEVEPIKYQKQKDGVLLEVGIPDLHLGKLCWAPECGQHYDSKIAQEVFRDALGELLRRVSGFNIERIVYPVGSDFFNVDGMANETTAGTPQREDGRWQKSYVAGRKLMVEAIYRMRQIAPVDVIMIPGNHDRERVFYLGDSIAGWFHRTPGVSVNNSPSPRKYYQWGLNLLGFTHGDQEKRDKLPLIMATEVPALWANTRFREFHCGHYHSRRDIHFQPVEEFNGIRVRYLPSLCTPDDWHHLRGFNGLRAAEVYVWGKNDGCVGNFSYSPPEELQEAA